MKYKVIALAALAVIIYSCASKSSVPTTEVKKNEAAAKTEPAAKNEVTLLPTRELAEGKSLYENNCAKCHKLYDRNAFSEKDWKPIVAQMQKKAHLDDLAGQKIYNYLTMK